MTSRTPDEALWEFFHSNEEHTTRVEITDDPMPEITHRIRNVYDDLKRAVAWNLPETRERIERAYKLQYISGLERITLLQILEHAV